MTQEQVAELGGTTRQTILSIENGQYPPSVCLAFCLSQDLGASVEAIFELEE